MTLRATPAATVPLDCGSAAIVAASLMAAAVASTVSGFRRDSFAPANVKGPSATQRSFRDRRYLRGRCSLLAAILCRPLVSVLSTQYGRHQACPIVTTRRADPFHTGKSLRR
jgi:hypothetical protein